MTFQGHSALSFHAFLTLIPLHDYLHEIIKLAGTPTPLVTKELVSDTEDFRQYKYSTKKSIKPVLLKQAYCYQKFLGFYFYFYNTSSIEIEQVFNSGRNCVFVFTATTLSASSAPATEKCPEASHSSTSMR